MIKVAINGFGRIGRLVFRIMEEDSAFEVVAINDLTNADDLAYLLKYDTAQGNYRVDEISSEGEYLIVGGRRIRVYAETNPENLPWKELGIDEVFECTGRFTDKESASAHIKAGAKKVIISAPAKGDVKTIVYNVNEDTLDGSEEIISAASCTTNCLAPVLSIIEKEFGINKGYMTTVHAYTNDQTLLDLNHKKGYMSRRGRAAAANIVPTSTGAATAIGKVIPSLDGRFKGNALRVPTVTGSMIDLTLELKKKVTKEDVNQAFIKNQNESVKVTNDPIVSSDIIGSNVGALVDLLLTDVLDADGELVKVVAWYDNEMGYSHQMVRTAKKLGEFIK
ncbi:MAG: type I glyceraldehyde-3-phosphate dehydrogenase [Bacilli bacterium]|nr:type I glyceraldehyde-3-phosphate dehydrogenase [Bacilli bacterium]